MKNKQISGGIILSFVSQFLGIAVSLVYTPIMIKILGQNEYGLYQLVLSVVNYLNLMNFGFNGAYIRYYSLAKVRKDEKEVANINGMFFTIFLILAAAVAVGGVVLYTNIGVLGSNLTAADYVTAKKLLVIMVANLALSFPNSLFVAYMSANERFVFQKAITIVVNILIPVLNLPLLMLGFGSVGMVWATFLLTVLRLVINVVYCFRKLDIKITFGYFNKVIFKDLMAFTFFIFLSDLVDQLNTNVDKLLLGRMSGTIAVALYSVAYNLKTHYTTITWIVPEMYIPEVNRVAVQEDPDSRLTDLFIRVGRMNNFLVLLVITGFVLCGKQFVRLWVGEDYDVSYYAAVILMLSGYIPAVQTLGVNVQNAKNMHHMRSIVYFFVALVNVASSVVLIKRWGVIGTSVGTLLATFLGHGLFMNWYYHNRIGLNVLRFWKEILKSVPYCAIAVLLGVVILYYFPIDSWFRFIAFVAVYIVIYCVLLFTLGMKRDERASILAKIKRKIGNAN